MREEYTSLWDFLKKTPKNRNSIILINLVCLVMIGGVIIESGSFDPAWTRYGIIGFLLLIAGLAWYRVYHIYKKLS